MTLAKASWTPAFSTRREHFKTIEFSVERTISKLSSIICPSLANGPDRTIGEYPSLRNASASALPNS